MPISKKIYRQIAKDILAQITGGEITEEHTYVSGKTIYRLSNAPIAEIKEVKEVTTADQRVFEMDIDYRFTDDSVYWLSGGEHPEEDGKFAVTYTFTRAPDISDVNPGSVVRTVVEAISREIEYLYGQIEEAYLSGFIDTAKGDALDLVVSVLGIKRKPPQSSSGFVTFGRNTEPETVPVMGEVHLYEGSQDYTLKKSSVKEIVKIEGKVNENPLIFEEDIDYSLIGRRIRWLPDGTKPDSRSVFQVDYITYQEIIIPKGSVVSTFSQRPDELISFTTTEDTPMKVVEEGKWEAEAPIICDASGRRGNVLAGTITVMPQPVAGVEYVINKGDLTNGVEVERDNQLRERAKHALQFAGKATVPSLETALSAIEGVRTLRVEDMPDGVVGVVQVIVDGGDLKEIVRVIDDTRAAGIKVEFKRPSMVYIDVSLVLTLSGDTTPEVAGKEAEKAIANYIKGLGIGDDVLFSKIIESSLSVKGVLDVTNVLLTAAREEEIFESEIENITITNEERAEPRTINLLFELR